MTALLDRLLRRATRPAARFALVESSTGDELQTDTFLMDASDADLKRSLRLMDEFGLASVRYVPDMPPDQVVLP